MSLNKYNGTRKKSSQNKYKNEQVNNQVGTSTTDRKTLKSEQVQQQGKQVVWNKYGSVQVQ